MPQPPLDQVNTWVLGALIVVALVLAGESGFRWARARGKSQQSAQADVVVAALLGLLGLLLAFSFGIVEERFAERKSLVIEEANAIGTTYLRTDMLPAAQAEPARRLLRDYVDVRLHVRSVAAVMSTLAKTEELQHALWREATAAAGQDPRSLFIALYVDSLNRVIDLHQKRITVALYHRLPISMLATLCAIALLSLIAHGYRAGLEKERALLPTFTLVVAVAAVLLVIVELDRPWQRMFNVSQDALVSVRKSMSAGH